MGCSWGFVSQFLRSVSMSCLRKWNQEPQHSPANPVLIYQLRDDYRDLTFKWKEVYLDVAAGVLTSNGLGEPNHSCLCCGVVSLSHISSHANYWWDVDNPSLHDEIAALRRKYSHKQYSPHQRNSVVFLQMIDEKITFLFFIMILVAAWVQRKTPVRLRSRTSCHCSFFILINKVSLVIPVKPHHQCFNIECKKTPSKITWT